MSHMESAASKTSVFRYKKAATRVHKLTYELAPEDADLQALYLGSEIKLKVARPFTFGRVLYLKAEVLKTRLEALICHNSKTVARL